MAAVMQAVMVIGGGRQGWLFRNGPIRQSDEAGAPTALHESACAYHMVMADSLLYGTVAEVTPIRWVTLVLL
ncbi:MAG: hypothetical protein RQ867_01765 [Mariprofundaceae bacterium]|nr:hypothetical protein [Mariprofundaceae bacterium]